MKNGQVQTAMGPPITTHVRSSEASCRIFQAVADQDWYLHMVQSCTTLRSYLGSKSSVMIRSGKSTLPVSRRKHSTDKDRVDKTLLLPLAQLSLNHALLQSVDQPVRCKVLPCVCMFAINGSHSNYFSFRGAAM